MKKAIGTVTRPFFGQRRPKLTLLKTKTRGLVKLIERKEKEQ